MRPRSLKDLTKEHLQLDIQGGEHDPVSFEVFCVCGSMSMQSREIDILPDFIHINQFCQWCTLFYSH